MPLKLGKNIFKGIKIVKTAVTKTKKVGKGASVAAVPVFSISQNVQSQAQHDKATESLFSKLSSDMNIISPQSALVCGSGESIKKKHVEMKKNKVVESPVPLLKIFKCIKNRKYRKVGIFPERQPNVLNECNTSQSLPEVEMPEESEQSLLEVTEIVTDDADETKVLELEYPCVCSEENYLPLQINESLPLKTHSRWTIDQDIRREIKWNTAVPLDNSLPKSSDIDQFEMGFKSISAMEQNTDIDEDIESELTLGVTMFTVHGGEISAMSVSEERICVGNEHSCKYGMIDLQTAKVQRHGQPPTLYFQCDKEDELVVPEEIIRVEDQSNQWRMSNSYRIQMSKVIMLENEKEFLSEESYLISCGTNEIENFLQYLNTDGSNGYANIKHPTNSPNKIEIQCMKNYFDNIEPNTVNVRCLKYNINALGPNVQIRALPSAENVVSNPVVLDHDMYPTKNIIVEKELNKDDVKQTCTFRTLNKSTTLEAKMDSKLFREQNLDIGFSPGQNIQNHVSIRNENIPVCGNESRYKGCKYKAPQKHTKTKPPEGCCYRGGKPLDHHASSFAENATQTDSNKCTGDSCSSKKQAAFPDVLKCILLLANQISSGEAKLEPNTALVEYRGPPGTSFEDILQFCIKYALVTLATVWIVYSVYSILRNAFLQNENNQEELLQNAQVAVAGNAGRDGAVIVVVPGQPVHHVLHQESYPVQCEEDLIRHGLLNPRRNRALQPRADELPFIDLRGQIRIRI